MTISIDAINESLRVRLENEENFNPAEELNEIEQKWKLVPNEDTFHLLLEKLALMGAIEQLDKMVHEMVQRGINASSHPRLLTLLVYANAVRGHNQKVASMIQQAKYKFGDEGEALALGAASLAAAAAGRRDRLRELLRKLVNSSLKLRLRMEDVFEIIWMLSERSVEERIRGESIVGEILMRCQHPPGFFRFLYREIERHISASHFYTSMMLLEETMRVGESLRRQDRTLFAEQMVGKMCRAMVRSGVDRENLIEMANRMQTTIRLRSCFIHDELMLSALTLKAMDSDARFELFGSLVAMVDPQRERPHLILPILAATLDVDERLKILFRSTALGYNNLETLDPRLFVKFVLQPLYDRSSWLLRRRNSVNPLRNVVIILHSFGLSKSSVWWIMHGWWTLVKDEQRVMAAEMKTQPLAQDILPWLRQEYSLVFVEKKDAFPPTPLSQARLETVIQKEDAKGVLSLLATHGWPPEADLSSSAPRVLQLLLREENDGNIMKWLHDLSRECLAREDLRQEQKGSPLTTTHLLMVLHHRATAAETTPKQIVEMVHELRRLFPRAEATFDAEYPCKRILAELFMYKKGAVLSSDAIDDLTNLLRTLLKLEMVNMTGTNEGVTPFCVIKALHRFGWNTAVQLWQRFLTTFSFGNGFIGLLSHSLKAETTAERLKLNVPFLLHKAHTCLSASRIHSMHAAVLVNLSKIEEAEEIMESHGSEIQPYDCSVAFRLVNGVRYPAVTNAFIRAFPALCLSRTNLAEKPNEARNMLNLTLKYCEAKRLGPLIVELEALFAKYGVVADDVEKKRVLSTLKEHETLVKKWIYAPDGLLSANVNDSFLKEHEWMKYVRKRRSESTSQAVL